MSYAYLKRENEEKKLIRIMQMMLWNGMERDSGGFCMQNKSNDRSVSVWIVLTESLRNDKSFSKYFIGLSFRDKLKQLICRTTLASTTFLATELKIIPFVWNTFGKQKDACCVCSRVVMFAAVSATATVKSNKRPEQSEWNEMKPFHLNRQGQIHKRKMR